MTKLVIGEIIKPHGIKGEIKIKPLTDNPDDFKSCKDIFVGGIKQKLLNVRIAEGEIYAVFKGVADRNAAELLRGKLVETERENMPPLGDGRFYIIDVIGCKVVTDGGAEIGEVTGITRSGACDVYTVKGAKSCSFPLVLNLLVSMDTLNKTMVVSEKRLDEVAVYEN